MADKTYLKRTDCNNGLVLPGSLYLFLHPLNRAWLRALLWPTEQHHDLGPAASAGIKETYAFHIPVSCQANLAGWPAGGGETTRIRAKAPDMGKNQAKANGPTAKHRHMTELS